jgi:hypothetical protein
MCSMYRSSLSTYCSQAFAVLVGVAEGAADVLVGAADDLAGDDDGFTGAADELVGALEDEGLAVLADDGADDEGLPPPLLAPSARILAAACSASTTM